MMTRSMLTPISVAVSGSWATARMPAAEPGAVHELVEGDHHDDQRAHDDEHLVVRDRSRRRG